MHDDADGQAEELVDPAHPLGVAVGQVVVDGDDVDAFAFERVQVHGQRGDQRLAFAGFHFGDFAAVEDDAADQLHIEMAHVENAAAGFAADGEGFKQQVVERRALASRCLNSTVLAARSISESCCISGSRSLMAAMRGRMALISRSFLVPKTLEITLSITFVSFSH